ncbi:hypothetical protein NADE_005471 [Nannochloris sp. 'desiccata']|nr:hypothetical protein NADE_005471 [Chlorella desiccata (nom. nud.)]
MRNTAAIQAGAHSSVDIVELLGEWKSGSTGAGSYLSKSQSSALLAHLALAGFKGPFDYYLGRAEVHVPDAWVEAVMPGVKGTLYIGSPERHQRYHADWVRQHKDMQKLQSTIKGRTKVSKLDLKIMLDTHWQATAGWPAVCNGKAEDAGA